MGTALRPARALWGAPCHTADPDPAHANQEFELVPAPRGAPGGGSGGAVQLRSRLSGLCVAAALPGGGLEQQPCPGAGAWQLPAAPAAAGWWQLEPAGGAPLCVTAPGNAMRAW